MSTKDPLLALAVDSYIASLSATGWAIDSTWTVTAKVILGSTAQPFVHLKVRNDADITVATGETNGCVLSANLPVGFRPSMELSQACQTSTTGGMRQVSIRVDSAGGMTIRVLTSDATGPIYLGTIPAGLNGVTFSGLSVIFHFIYPLL